MKCTSVQAAGFTDVGLRRPNNQDNFIARNGVYIVCDGMGGERGGEQASAATVDAFAQVAQMPTRTQGDIHACLMQAQRNVRSIGQRLGGLAGTTVTGIVLPSWEQDAPHGKHAQLNGAHAGDESDDDSTFTTDDCDDSDDDLDATQRSDTAWAVACSNSVEAVPEEVCYVVNVGDSRTYHLEARDDGSWNEQSLTQITHDHSSRQEAIDRGMSVEEATRTIARNMITQCIGAPNGIAPDIFVVQASGRFIICSDGLHGELTDDTIAKVAASHEQAEHAAQALIQAALAAGGSDNVTVIVVDICNDMHTMPWSGVHLDDYEDVDSEMDATIET